MSKTSINKYKWEVRTEAYIAEVQTVVLWKNDVNIVVQVLHSSRKTGNNISKASYLHQYFYFNAYKIQKQSII